mgnify:CR=1 FL=1
MSAAHRAHADVSPAVLVERAARIGPHTERLVAQRQLHFPLGDNYTSPSG